MEERLSQCLESLKDRPGLLAASSDPLLEALETKGYFNAASFLSQQLLQQERCSFSRATQRKLTHYSKVEEGQPAPLFSLKHPAAIRLHFPENSVNQILEHAPKTLVLFWSSSCSHCQSELPRLADLQSQLEGQHIALLSISLDTDKGMYLDTARQYAWPHYSDFLGWESPVAQAFEVFATPSFFLIEQGGRLEKEFLSVAQLKAYLGL